MENFHEILNEEKCYFNGVFHWKPHTYLKKSYVLFLPLFGTSFSHVAMLVLLGYMPHKYANHTVTSVDDVDDEVHLHLLKCGWLIFGINSRLQSSIVHMTSSAIQEELRLLLHIVGWNWQKKYNLGKMMIKSTLHQRLLILF